MKIGANGTTAGFPAGKNDRQGKAPKLAKAVADPRPETQDELELTGKKATALDTAPDAGAALTSEGPDTDTLEAVKQKLAFVGGFIQNNPEAALSAQAHLDPETVARLII